MFVFEEGPCGSCVEGGLGEDGRMLSHYDLQGTRLEVGTGKGNACLMGH